MIMENSKGVSVGDVTYHMHTGFDYRTASKSYKKSELSCSREEHNVRICWIRCQRHCLDTIVKLRTQLLHASLMRLCPLL